MGRSLQTKMGDAKDVDVSLEGGFDARAAWKKAKFQVCCVFCGCRVPPAGGSSAAKQPNATPPARPSRLSSLFHARAHARTHAHELTRDGTPPSLCPLHNKVLCRHRFSVSLVTQLQALKEAARDDHQVGVDVSGLGISDSSRRPIATLFSRYVDVGRGPVFVSRSALLCSVSNAHNSR